MMDGCSPQGIGNAGFAVGSYLMKPPKASAGVLMPVRISARMMPVEMTENGTLPDTKAMIVTSRMTSVISNGLIWVVLLWITSTLQMQSSGT